MTSQQAANSGVAEQEPAVKATALRVKVIDNTRDGRPVVNVRMPIGVVKFGMKMARAFSPELKDANLDWDSISAMIDEGARGELVHVEDEAEHKTVEVWVE